MTAQPDQRGDTRADPTPQHAAAGGLCTDRLVPSPPDAEHDGWDCIRSAGHTEPDRDGTEHLAKDGTRW
ncbi:MAG TPA: hypothetical protein VGL02_30290 [Streptomyces sp.]